MIDWRMRRASGAQLVFSQLRESLRMLLAERAACRRLTEADPEMLESLVEQMRLLVDHPAELTIDP